MKKYYKNNQLVARPKSIIYKGCTYLNPKDELLKRAGYEIREEESQTPVVTNETIKSQRHMAYRLRADQYFIAYQAYTELGEYEKAAQMKNLWIAERQRIDEQYPYTE